MKRKFHKHFHLRLKHDKWFREQIHSLRGQRLLCFCKPLPCHGDIIAEYLNRKS